MSENEGVFTPTEWQAKEDNIGCASLAYALEDALRDLVQTHGLEYLDVFQKRRQDRMREIHRASAEFHQGALDALTDDDIEICDRILERSIVAVKRDPTPSI